MMWILKQIIKISAVIGLFVVLPLVAADIRIDKVYTLHKHNSNCVYEMDYFDPLLRKYYFSSIFLSSAWSNWRDNIVNLLTRIKGEDAKKVIEALDQQSALSFKEFSDDETGESIVEIYTIKCEKEVIVKK